MQKVVQALTLNTERMNRIPLRMKMRGKFLMIAILFGGEENKNHATL
jgi:hypothetical protein